MNQDLNDIYDGSPLDMIMNKIPVSVAGWPAPSDSAIEVLFANVADVCGEDVSDDEKRERCSRLIDGLYRDEESLKAIAVAEVHKCSDAGVIAVNVKGIAPRGLGAKVDLITKRIASFVKEYKPEKAKIDKIAAKEDAERRRQEFDVSNGDTLAMEGREDIVVLRPSGWRCDHSGVYKYDSKEDVNVQVSSRPILPTCMVLDHKPGPDGNRKHRFKLEWTDASSWRSAIIDRGTTQDLKAFVAEMSAVGAPVNRENAAELSKFISLVDEENIGVMPKTYCTEQMGFVGEDGSDGFMLGHQHITKNGGSQLVGDFREGVARAANAMRQRGSFEEWKTAVETIMPDHPLSMVAIYSSLAAPFIPILDCSNIVLDWGCGSSSGKSTLLYVSASIWGCPSEIEIKWDSTQNGIEKMSYGMNGLPLCVDESTNVDTEVLIKHIYDFANGVGRTRGKPGGTGLQDTLTWKGMLISTGESVITTREQTRGGAVMRVIALQAQPFGAQTPENGDLIKALKLKVRKNYGHAGRMIIERAVSDERFFDRIVAKYEELCEKHANRLTNNAENRFSDRMALIELGAVLAHDVLGIKRPKSSGIEALLQELLKGLAAGDEATRALEMIYDWSHENEKGFLNSDGFNGNVVGLWYPDVENWSSLCISSKALKEALTKSGFKPSVLTEWKKKGYCELDAKGQNPIRRIGKTVNRFISIKRSAFVEAGLFSEEDLYDNRDGGGKVLKMID